MIPLLEQNKDFIANEAWLFLQSTFPEYPADKELCRRDIHMVMDVVLAELHIEGYGPYISDLVHPDLCENYWQMNKYKKSFRVLRNQDDASFSLLDYTGQLIKLVLQNKPVVARGTNYSQVFNQNLAISEDRTGKVDEVVSLVGANAGAGLIRTPHIEFLEEYFDKGFVVTETPKDIHKRLWDEINKTNWVTGKGTSYKTIPDWYVQKERRYIDPTGADRQVVERWEGLYGYYHAPQSLKDIAADLIMDPMFEPLRLYRPPNAMPKFIHFWNGSENTQHHVDSIDGSDVMIFCYATDAGEWQEEWGGYINLMKEVGGKFHYLRNVMPDDGRMVVVNNAAPIFKHGIRNLTNDKINRYTFIFHYTWTYNE